MPKDVESVVIAVCRRCRARLMGTIGEVPTIPPGWTLIEDGHNRSFWVCPACL